jgi:hypothetical protein
MKLKTNLKAGIRSCPYKNCSGAEDEPNHNQSTTGLKLKTSLKAGAKVCPYRNCAGADDEPNHNQSTR